jgi:hypothetical protein
MGRIKERRGRAGSCSGVDTLGATASAFRGSPRMDADGDKSIRTTFRMVAPVTLGTTWDDGAATMREGDNTSPNGTNPTVGGGRTSRLR